MTACGGRVGFEMAQVSGPIESITHYLKFLKK
jgi:hypothetical protein